MKTYIKSYQLLNFQSWSNKSPKIDLATDVINIIEGENETGKSVFYKVLYNFVFPGYWEPSELIRRGCDQAAMILSLTNGHIITYFLSQKHHKYILLADNTEKSWDDVPLPQELISELGLVIDYTSRIILNVIDKDVELPFIKTRPQFNASLIRSVVEPQDITNMFENMQNILDQTSIAYSTFKVKRDECKAAADALGYTDVDSLVERKNYIDELNLAATKYVELDSAISNMQDTISREPDLVGNPDCVKPKLNIYHSINQVQDTLLKYSEIASETVQEVSNPEKYAGLISHLYACTQIISGLSLIQKEILNTPEICHEVICGDLLEIYHLVKDILPIFDSCTEAYSQTCQIGTLVDTTLAAIEKIRAEVGVCPTCGRLLEAVSHETCIHNS